MCAHPDHEVVTLPGGQVDETHVFPAGWESPPPLSEVARFIRAHEDEPARFLVTTNALQYGGA